MTDTHSETRTFGGWQQEKVAFIFGLSGRRAALAAGAVLALILPVTTGRMPEAIVFWPLGGVLAAIAFTRFGGRTVDEWAVSAISFALVKARGQHRFAGGPFAPPATPGPEAHEANKNENQNQELDLPGILAPLRVKSAPAARGRDIAIVQHPLDNTWTAVAGIGCPGIGLADSGRQYQRVAGWGALLAGLCTDGSPVIRVQALQRLVPESGVALRAWHAVHVTGDVPELAHDVTMELLHQSTLVTNRREAYLAFTMDARKVRGQIRAAGGGDTGTARVLIRYLQGLAHAISGGDLRIEDWLSTRDLAEVLRTAFDPHSQSALATRRALAASRSQAAGIPAGTNLRNAGPVYAETRPGSYAHDGAVSVTYWVQEWPSEAWCTGLGPLLSDSGSRRSLSLIYEPLAPRAAERAVMRERTARHVAVRMRQRTGQIIPEHERVASTRAQRQDAERAAGHGLVRFAGYLTLTVNDERQLADACAALEADAAQARIEVRRMWFAQDSGFAMGALPLGLGLPARRW